MTNLKERNQKIVELMELGEFTLQDIGSMYGITRERARQIYHRHTGHGYQARAINHRNKKQAEKIKEPVFNCIECGNPETNQIKQSYKLCRNCRRKYRKQERNPWVLVKCYRCDRNFHPFRNRTNGEESKFCGMECYLKERWGKLPKKSLLIRLMRRVKNIWQSSK